MTHTFPEVGIVSTNNISVGVSSASPDSETGRDVAQEKVHLMNSMRDSC